MFALLLGACNQKDSESVDGGQADNDDANDQVADEATSDPVEGGTITGAMYSAPTGMFNPIFYEEAYEANILDFTHESLRSEEHTSELQSRGHLVCRLLLENKKI